MNVNLGRQPAGRRWVLAAAGGLLVSPIGGLPLHAASAPPVDKSQYHLFHPTPRDQLREMSTDRPDQTESAYTVDAGHFQVEMDAVGAVFDRDHSAGGDVETTAWGTSVNLKAGLLNKVDLQFILDPYATVKVKDLTTGAENTASGFGEFQTRLKVNLWGNDGGKTALAVMPFVKWPLSESGLRDGNTEGGIIVPWAVELPAGWGLGGITEFDFVSDDRGGRATEYFNTIALSHDLWGPLGGYVELAAGVSPVEDGGWLGQVDVGFTYAVNEDVQLDFGCNFGVTKSAPDFNPFIGLSWRL